jgi:hypothetical protein
MKQDRSEQVGITFAGELTVEGDYYFELTADRLVVRDDAVAFSFVGRDEYGDFTVDGVAPSDGMGAFVSPRVPVRYKGYERADEASFRLTQVELTPKSARCAVEGFWFQYKRSWAFSGELNRLRGRRRAQDARRG